MQTVVIHIEDKDDFILISKLLKKMKIKATVLSDEEKEEVALGKAIKKGMKTQNVSKSLVLKELRK